jgi:type I restriction enzyme S subunit
VVIGRKGTIDVPQYVDTPFWAIDTTFYCEVSDDADTKFLFYLFNTISWYRFNEATGVPSLNATVVENIEICVPSLSEQNTIALILSDMDAEIAALEARLAKIRQIKPGMMQELMTGRIRLI